MAKFKEQEQAGVTADREDVVSISEEYMGLDFRGYWRREGLRALGEAVHMDIDEAVNDLFVRAYLKERRISQEQDVEKSIKKTRRSRDEEQ